MKTEIDNHEKKLSEVAGKVPERVGIRLKARKGRKHGEGTGSGN